MSDNVQKAAEAGAAQQQQQAQPQQQQQDLQQQGPPAALPPPPLPQAQQQQQPPQSQQPQQPQQPPQPQQQQDSGEPVEPQAAPANSPPSASIDNSQSTIDLFRTRPGLSDQERSRIFEKVLASGRQKPPFALEMGKRWRFAVEFNEKTLSAEHTLWTAVFDSETQVTVLAKRVYSVKHSQQPHSGHKICVMVLKDPSSPLPEDLPAVERRALDSFVSRLAEKRSVLEAKRLLSSQEWRRAKDAWTKLIPGLSRTTTSEPSASDDATDGIAVDDSSDHAADAADAADADAADESEAEHTHVVKKKRASRATASPRRSSRVKNKPTKPPPKKRSKPAAKPAARSTRQRRNEELEENEEDDEEAELSAQSPSTSPPRAPLAPASPPPPPLSLPPAASPMPSSPPHAPQQQPQSPQPPQAQQLPPPVPPVTPQTGGYAPHLQPGVLANAYDMVGLNPRSGHGLSCVCCVCYGVHQRGCLCGMTFRR